ncbi:hypothetical protein BRADI_5g20171v3 [Brachypodium distachyon]|uniref:Uncharacterized protein n=1 Tax=Brachypodium distachyon TaxID=15368 RepID=A0A0Q3ED34_BRADI|nr:hypothetical protein BRADI_5g20171v3 [Brachypodium distachyon]
MWGGGGGGGDQRLQNGQVNSVRFVRDAEMIDQLTGVDNTDVGEEEDYDEEEFARGCGLNTQQIKDLDNVDLEDDNEGVVSIAETPLTEAQNPIKPTYSAVLMSAQKMVPMAGGKENRGKARGVIEENERRSERNIRLGEQNVVDRAVDRTKYKNLETAKVLGGSAEG